MKEQIKIVTRNVRSPRKYSKFNSISLCDNRGIIWARIDISRGSVSVDHLEGVRVNVRGDRGGLGDWDLDREFNRGWRDRYQCPSCGEEDEKYDPQDYTVKCKACGEVY